MNGNAVIDGGVTWSDVNNGGSYSGATTASLNINPAIIIMDGFQYQCIVIGPCDTKTSDPATLNVLAGCQQ